MKREESVTRRVFLKKGLMAGSMWATSGWLAACGAVGRYGTRAVTSNWAVGGTATMRGSYPDPFASSTEAPVELGELAMGPCHAGSPTRRDISEGTPGLPMRLSFRIVRAGTEDPFPGVTLDIWHANPLGAYSSFPAQSMCNLTARDYRGASFCRGVQVTDARGRATFDTVYPGWYPGRTPHIHLIARLDSGESTTTQLFFDDALSDAIYAAHPDYSGRANRDTTNRTDGVLAGVSVTPFLLQTARMGDGVLLAWKAIALRP